MTPTFIHPPSAKELTLSTNQTDYFVSRGEHASPADGRCAMEWVSYLAGEPHTDKPRCVDPILRRFAIALNDNLGGLDRQRLRPYLARCIGTAGDGRGNERMRLLREASRGFTGTYPTDQRLNFAGWVGSEFGLLGRVDEALDLFDRMLPKELIQVPVAVDADWVCALR